MSSQSGAIQWCAFEMQRLLHKHYINGFSLSQDYIPALKVITWPWASGSKHIWNRSFKWSTKHWFWSRGCKNIKGWNWKLEKNLPVWSRAWARQFRIWLSQQFFFQPLTLTSDIFAAPWSKWIFSTSFERSISYLFGARRQKPWYDIEGMQSWLKVTPYT